MTAAKDRLLTPQEVAELLNVPLGTLRAWRYRRTGPAFVRLGEHRDRNGREQGQVRYWESAVRRFPRRAS